MENGILTRDQTAVTDVYLQKSVSSCRRIPHRTSVLTVGDECCAGIRLVVGVVPEDGLQDVATFETVECCHVPHQGVEPCITDF